MSADDIALKSAAECGWRKNRGSKQLFTFAVFPTPGGVETTPLWIGRFDIAEPDTRRPAENERESEEYDMLHITCTNELKRRHGNKANNRAKLALNKLTDLVNSATMDVNALANALKCTQVGPREVDKRTINNPGFTESCTHAHGQPQATALSQLERSTIDLMPDLTRRLLIMTKTNNRQTSLTAD